MLLHCKISHQAGYFLACISPMKFWTKVQIASIFKHQPKPEPLNCEEHFRKLNSNHMLHAPHHICSASTHPPLRHCNVCMAMPVSSALLSVWDFCFSLSDLSSSELRQALNIPSRACQLIWSREVGSEITKNPSTLQNSVGNSIAISLSSDNVLYHLKHLVQKDLFLGFTPKSG